MPEPRELPPELVIELSPPIEVKGGKHESITLREPTVFQVRQAESHLRSGANVESMRRYTISLVARVAGVDEPVIEAMPIRKLNEAVIYLMGFIEAGQGTGNR